MVKNSEIIRNNFAVIFKDNFTLIIKDNFTLIIKDNFTLIIPRSSHCFSISIKWDRIFAVSPQIAFSS
jgi:hypothetical protein